MQCFRGESPPFLEVLLFALPLLVYTGCGIKEMTAGRLGRVNHHFSAALPDTMHTGCGTKEIASKFR